MFIVTIIIIFFIIGSIYFLYKEENDYFKIKQFLKITKNSINKILKFLYNILFDNKSGTNTSTDKILSEIPYNKTSENVLLNIIKILSEIPYNKTSENVLLNIIKLHVLNTNI